MLLNSLPVFLSPLFQSTDGRAWITSRLNSAIPAAGSEAGFVELMNQKADALKMNHTHFANTTGLSDDDHYSTAADMAKLLDYALDNDTFREIFTASRHSTGGTNVHPEGITFYSTLSEKLSDPAISGGKILGGKT